MVMSLKAAAIVELLLGGFFMVRGKNEIHVVLGSLALGFAIVTVATASILAEVRRASALRHNK